MKQYRFIGDPETYFWDFNLVPNEVYSGDVIAFEDETLDSILADVYSGMCCNNKELKRDAEEFLNDWEEVTNES